MTGTPFLFPFRMNLLLWHPHSSTAIQQTKWKNGFHRVKPHAEQVGRHACRAAPTAERRSMHLNNNNCSVNNPDCLIRITFFNNTANQNHYWCVHCPCRQPQPIRRLVVSAEKHRECRENEEKRAFVQDTWLVEKPAATAIKASAKACVESRCRTPAVPPSS